MKILWISPFVPYDTVGHAGGQNHNYYLKYIKRNTDFDITLISICEKEEISQIDLDKYAIRNIVKVYERNKLISLAETAFGKILLKRDGGLLNGRKYILLLQAFREYVSSGECPDVVITQWTEATLLYNHISKTFPNSKYIAIEEDVAFQGYQRKYEASRGFFRVYKRLKYVYLKKAEIQTLEKYDVVITLNNKDRDLLLAENISNERIFQMVSYYRLDKSIEYNPDIHKILFYGAMSRKENYLSAIWFIENVLNRLDDSFEFIIVGSNPARELMKYRSDRVVITGFVDSIAPYFSNCLCLASPLVMGAGIKIKVLEALAAGLPVLTNDIGSEGIGLVDGENYIHCEVPEDYLLAINELSHNLEMRNMLSKNGKEHIAKNFNTDASLEELICKIRSYEE